MATKKPGSAGGGRRRTLAVPKGAPPPPDAPDAEDKSPRAMASAIATGAGIAVVLAYLYLRGVATDVAARLGYNAMMALMIGGLALLALGFWLGRGPTRRRKAKVRDPL